MSKKLLAFIALVLMPLSVIWNAHQLFSAAGAEKPNLVQPPVLIGLLREKYIWVIGAHDPKRGWRTDEQAKDLFKGTKVFSVFGLKGAIGKTTIRKLKSGEEVGGWFAEGSRKFSEDPPRLALSAATRPILRLPRAQSLLHPTYRRGISSLLRARGLRVAHPRLTQNLRVDLNGDGADEVLLCAHSRDEMGRTPRARTGDYALVALRFLSKGKVKTIILASSVYTRAVGYTVTNRYLIISCADINGDGKMEIVIHSAYYEGDGAQVFTFDGRTARRVLTAGWGV